MPRHGEPAAVRVNVLDGRREVWINDPPPGGWVCGEPDDSSPEGICGMPTESIPCTTHHPGGED